MADTGIIAHLLRRAGFGASSDELANFSVLSYQDAVNRLVDYEAIPDDVDALIGQAGYAVTTSPRGNPFSPNSVIDDARQRWLFRMVYSQRPLQEKMTLFWHNYFATAYSKVAGVAGAANGTRLMAAKASEDPQQQRGQIELLRAHALGNVRDMLLAIAQDPAMLIWLDGNTNTKAQPQENFGRELLELFSRGVGYYTEPDVYAAARVFTGWNLATVGRTADGVGVYRFNYRPEQHETSAKTFSFPIYPNGGATIPARTGSAGIDDGLDLINAVAFHPETARRIATKLYAFFVSETRAPVPSFIDQLASVYLQSGTEMRPVLRFLLNSAPFLDRANQFTRYAWPVEYVVRSMKEGGSAGFSLSSALAPLVNMGQQLFEPPNVAGWELGGNWFSSGTMLARMNFAATLMLSQKQRLGAAAAAAGAKSSPQALVSYILSRLTSADLEAATLNDLNVYASAGITTWTGSDAQLQNKGSGLAHLILGSPEYQFI